MIIRNVEYVEKYGMDSLHSLNKLTSFTNDENANPNIQYTAITNPEQQDDWDFYVYLDIQETRKNIKNIKIYDDDDELTNITYNKNKNTKSTQTISQDDDTSLFCIFSNIGKKLVERNKPSHNTNNTSDFVPVLSFLCISSIFYVTSQFMTLTRNYSD